MKRQNDLKQRGLAIGLMLASAVVCAEPVTQIGRYTTVDNKPLASQINPLTAVQQVHFGTRIKTVGDAVTHWLLFSGFSLVEEGDQSDTLKTVLAKPLPQVDRNLGPVSVQEGLEVLVGKGIFTVVVDPLYRRVSFKLTPKFAQFYQKLGART